jgi:hypothetical protein
MIVRRRPKALRQRAEVHAADERADVVDDRDDRDRRVAGAEVVLQEGREVVLGAVLIS